MAGSSESERIARTVFVVTGNRLVDGRVVYLRSDRSWGPDLDAALELDDAAARDALLAEVQTRDRLVVTNVYAFEVPITARGERRLSARERLRAAGEAQTRRRLGLGD